MTWHQLSGKTLSADVHIPTSHGTSRNCAIQADEHIIKLWCITEEMGTLT